MTLEPPFDGSSKPFSIGMRAIAMEDWIGVDDRLGFHLAEKARLDATVPDVVFRAVPDTETAQAETRDALVDHLTTRFPEIYRLDGGAVVLASLGLRVDLDGPRAPLLAAAHLVADDLCLMRRKPDGWHLVAGAVHFPSSWSLADKIGRPMVTIHAPVPGFAGRMAAMVDRIFDNLAVGIVVERFNWSLHDDDHLHHPHPKPGKRAFIAEDGSILLDQLHVRSERQTLRKMPGSGDVLFTILTRQWRASTMPAPARARLAADLLALDDDQRRYKSLTATAPAIAAALACDMMA